MRSHGSSAKAATTPTHPKEVTETAEETEITEIDGQWAVPVRLWGDSFGKKLGIAHRLVGSSKKVEECVCIVSAQPCLIALTSRK